MPAGTHITPGAPAPEGFYSPMTMNDQGHIEGGAGGGGFANWQDPSHDTSPEQQQAHIAAARQRALQAQFEQDAINAGNAAYHATLARHQQEMAHLGYDSASHTGEGEWMAQQAGQAAHERHIQSDPHAGTHQALQTEVERQRQERMHSAAQSAGEQAAQSALHDAHSWGYTREQGYQHAQRAGQQAYEREMARLNSPQGQADRAWNNLSQRPADVQALGRIQNRMAIDSTPPAVRYSANHCQLIANAKNVTRQNTGS